MSESASFKYFAFISYSSKDVDWGKSVQKKLEGYRMPATLCSEHGWARKPMKPVFFAPTDIQPGDLTVELQERLKASRHLIVICSPNSAKSSWVGKEIKFFYSLGRPQNIHFFIVGGTPHGKTDDTKCYNPVIESLGLSGVLGVNIHEKVSRLPWVNEERAYVQLITKLLGVEFDSIWQRHKRMMIENVLVWCIGILVVIATLCGVWYNTKPVDVTMRLNEISVHNDNLPKLEEAVVTLSIDNETKTDTFNSIEDLATFANIPHSAIGKDAHITVESKNWLKTDTTLILSTDLTLNIARDPHPYGDIQFRLWNDASESPYPNIPVTINGYDVTADAKGLIHFTMPLAEQASFYIIKALMALDNDTLHMPTTASTSIIVK